MDIEVNKKGITLIELIIVMVIIAIGATLMVPGIGAWLPNYRLRSATRDIVSTMRVAQMRAVSHNIEYAVSFNVGGNSYILHRRNTGGCWDNDGDIQTLPAGIQINNITFPIDPCLNNRPLAQFNPNSTSSSGSITLINTKGTTRRIVLTASTGRVRIE
jgi:prepilin-type N-terminal cleavage/methylation domain-containing protein